MEGPEEIKVHDNARPEAVGGTTNLKVMVSLSAASFPSVVLVREDV